MNKKILLLGAGGIAKMIIEILMEQNKFSEIALLDNFPTSSHVMGIPVIGKCDELENFRNDYAYAFVCIGDPKIRAGYFSRIMAEKFIVPNVIHPTACISRSACLGIGIFVNAMGVIEASSRLGNGCYVNTSALVAHDCELGECVHMAPRSTTTGNVRIGDNSFIGASSCIINHRHIGRNVTVAAGAAVITDIPDNVMVAGCPAVIKKHI